METTRTYTRELLAGVSRYLQAHGPWSTFLELRAFESSLPPWLDRWDGDGIITRTHSETMAEAIARTGLPAVEVRSTNYERGFPFVGMDNQRIGLMVAEHFVNRGYRNFAAYTLDTESFFRERVINFVTPIEDAGARCELLPAASEASPSDWETHQAALITWLTSLPKPIGIFATNDQLAVRLIDACQRAHLSVPDEVAVVGCEDEKTLCEFTSPTLTSVQFDGEEVGYQAARILDHLMEGHAPPESPILIPPKGITVRGSSDEFVIEDSIVLRAVRLIRDEALIGITVGAICERLGVSRSTLERRMKTSLKRGTKEEILRIQFREVKRLLHRTSLTIEAIAEQTGLQVVGVGKSG
ncbi:MAG: DNA-binding transcriptional regulator, partial [Verrucomicrobiota bacterium]